MPKLNRDFEYKGLNFHLNDNPFHGEFEGKYSIVFFHEGHEKWMQVTTANSKKEAREIIKMFYEDRRYPFELDDYGYIK